MILITRHKPDAEKLSLELSKLNKTNHVESLLTFFHYKKKLNFDNVTDLIITSMQSVIALRKNNLTKSKKFKSLCIYVVGKNISIELKKLGCKKIKKVFLDSQELIQYLENQNLEKNIFYYLSGNIVNEEIVKSLNRLKVKFDRKIIYRSKVRDQLSKQTIKLIKRKEINTVLLYSSFTALSFIQLIRKAGITRDAKCLSYICLSPKIAALMRVRQFKKTIHAQEPTQRSILKLIREI